MFSLLVLLVLMYLRDCVFMGAVGLFLVSARSEENDQLQSLSHFNGLVKITLTTETGSYKITNSALYCYSW